MDLDQQLQDSQAMPFFQYFNGNVSRTDADVVKTNDLGLLRGYGVFDYFRTYNGVPFRFGDYWRRFENSARLLNLTIPVDQAEAEALIADLHSRSDEREVAFRLVLTGGYSSDSVHVIRPNFLIRSEPLPTDNPAGRLAGIKVLPYEYVRDLPEIKSTSYMHMIRMADVMQEQGAADLLFHKDDEVSELTRSNIFIIKGNRLITSDRHILKGITRKTVLELAAPDFEVQERAIMLDELMEADEVFTTSTTKWVMPVVAVGARQIANGKAGEGSLHLQSKFEALVSAWGR